MTIEMWAIFDKKTNSCLSCSRHKPEVSIVFDTDKKIKRKMLGCGNNFYDYGLVYNKPVWVTDRDPFENLRQLVKNKKLYPDAVIFKRIITNELEKAIKEWDKEASK